MNFKILSFFISFLTAFCFRELLAQDTGLVAPTVTVTSLSNTPNAMAKGQNQTENTSAGPHGLYQVLIELKPNVSDEDKNRVFSHGVVGDRVSKYGMILFPLAITNGLSIQQVIDELKKDPAVGWVQRNLKLPARATAQRKNYTDGLSPFFTDNPNPELLDSKMVGTLPQGFGPILEGSINCYYTTPIRFNLFTQNGVTQGRLKFVYNPGGGLMLLKAVELKPNGHLLLTLNESYGQGTVIKNNWLVMEGIVEKDGSYSGTYLFSSGLRGRFSLLYVASPQDE